MLILAIDPGTACGWALMRDGLLIDSGVWRLKKPNERAGVRYVTLTSELTELLETSAIPDLLAYEDVRAHAGTDAAHVYGGIVATIQHWCETYGIKYQGVPVGTIKKTMTGRGNASKVDVIAAVKERYNLTAKHDQADAIAIAYTASQKERLC